MIEEDVVPRLLKAHGTSVSDVVAQMERPSITEDDIAEVVRLVTYQGPALVSAHLQALLASGISIDDMVMNLMAPAARMLGEFWEEDRVDFLEVTFGLASLQHALRELSPAFEQSPRALSAGPRILLATAPAEQHTFGVLVVEEFFRRAGWNVTLCVTDSQAQIVDTVAAENFAIVGFSLSCDHLIDDLIPTIGALHKSMGENRPDIMVGGRSFADNPEFLSASGADALVTDGRDSVTLARRLLQKSQKETGLVQVGT